MPQRGYRSRTTRRVRVKLPGGDVGIHYRRPRRGPAKCAQCGRPLHGIRPSLRLSPRSSKRPSRPHGGVLCGSCLKERITKAVWAYSG